MTTEEFINKYKDTEVNFQATDGYNTTFYSEEIHVEFLLHNNVEFSQKLLVSDLLSKGNIVRFIIKPEITIRWIVYEFETKYKEGFTKLEITEVYYILNKEFKIDKTIFKKALNNITCMVMDDQVITYHQDIEHAFLCSIEDTELNIGEWDKENIA